MRAQNPPAAPEPVVVMEESVLFPTIGGGKVEFLRASCLRVTDWDNSDRPVHAPGFSDAREILIDARADERPSTMELGVQVRMERRDFAGDSFGLAVALADKLARFGRAHPDRQILATGALAHGGRGALSAVAGFDGKTLGVLDHIAAHSLKNAIYVYCETNQIDLKDETRALLDATCSETGLECLPISHLKEASLLWSQPSLVATLLGPPKRRPWRVAAAGGVLAAILAVGAFALWPRPPVLYANSAEDCIDARTGTVAVGPVASPNLQSQADFGLTVQLNGAQPIYAVGDPVIISISVQRTAYIKALSLDRDGKIVAVFPNRFQGDPLLLPGHAVTISLHAAKPAGSSLLKVIAMGAPFGQVLGETASPSPNPELLLPSAEWQAKAVCLKITT